MGKSKIIGDKAETAEFCTAQADSLRPRFSANHSASTALV
jgi:hypothetical protein